MRERLARQPPVAAGWRAGFYGGRSMMRAAGQTSAADHSRLPAAALTAGDAFVSLDTPKPAPLRRKLHAGHFAFARALVQGLDTAASWERYLALEGAHSDARVVRRTIGWLRDELAAASRRHDRHGIGRLIQVDVQKIAADAAPALPTLEEFAASRGLEGFSEQEQVDAYREEFGEASVRLSRRARLMAKQLDALRWLESLVAEPPHAADAVVSWFHPQLATRLEAAGLITLQDLFERINGVGRHWYRGMPAIGAGKALRITEWLTAHVASIGIQIGTHAKQARAGLSARDLQTVVPHRTGIVPFEKLIVPSELNGANGLYRLPQQLCLMRAATDDQAILAWIRSKRGLSADRKRALKARRGIDPNAFDGPLDWLRTLSHTQRAYLKEAERFLLWAIVARRKPLSSMNLEDCEAYREFLGNPQPGHLWCGARGRERWGPAWRPFEGPLSASAQRTAVTILKALYRWLGEQCYLRGNPWAGVATPKVDRNAVDVGRSFTQAQWDWISDCAADLPITSANTRLRLALRLLYATGLRISEVVAARVGDMTWRSYPPDSRGAGHVEGWELRVVGKGEKVRTVPVPDDAVKALGDYLAVRGLGPTLSAAPADAHLLGLATDIGARARWSALAKVEVDPRAGIGPGALNDQFKRFFSRCADQLQDTDPVAADRLRSASVHWLRHTHGSHVIAAGVDVKVLQQNMGHASLATTTNYSTSESRRQMQELGKFWDAGKGAAVASAAAEGRSGQRLVPATGIEAASRVAHLTLRLDIENNSKSGPGKKKAREFIEKRCIAHYLVRRVDDRHYLMAIPYDDDEYLESAIDDLLSAINRTAVNHHCFAEADLHDDITDRYWS
jgi:site-specific recombinase XerD